MSRGDLEKLTITQLRALAKEVGVSIPPRATKDAIVQLLVRVRGAQSARIASASSPAGAGRKPAARGASRAKVETRKQPPSERAGRKGVTATTAGRAPSKAAPVERTTRKGSTAAGGAERREHSERKSAGARARTTAGNAQGRSRRTSVESQQAPRGRERASVEQKRAVPSAAKHAAPASDAGRPVHGVDTTEPAAVQRGIEPARGLPSEYGVDRLALLARDPRWAFAYWELSERRVRDVSAHAGREPRLVLRVYEVSEGGGLGRFRDWIVDGRIGRLYVELDVPGGVFVAEIGARALDGTFVPAARSEAAHLPPDRPSLHVDRGFRPEGPVEAPTGGLPSSPGLGGESGAAGVGGGAAGLPTSPSSPSSPGGSPPWTSPTSPWGTSPSSPASAWGTSPSSPASPWGTSPSSPASPWGTSPSSPTSAAPSSPGLPSSPRSWPGDSTPGDPGDEGLPPRRS